METNKVNIKYSPSIWIIFSLVLICLIVQPVYAQNKKFIGLIYKLDPARRIMVNGKLSPDYKYDPRSDLVQALTKGGFYISNKKKVNPDLLLEVEYTERMQQRQYFADEIVVDLFRVSMMDSRNAVVVDGEVRKIDTLLRLHHRFTYSPEMVKDYVNNQLSADISERLASKDEMEFLVNKFDQIISSKNAFDRIRINERFKLLVRMFELLDKRAEEAFLQTLLSPDPRQRWVAKFGLLELGLSPDSISQYFVPFQMVNFLDSRNTVAYNFLKNGKIIGKYKEETWESKMYPMIQKYGTLAIEVIVDNIRCEEIMPGIGWYGGGQVSDVNPVYVLKRLRGYQLDLREPTVVILSRELDEDYANLRYKTLFSYRQILLDIFSELANAEQISYLQNYFTEHPELTKECETSIDKINKRAN